jgi:DNA transformation protein and related proteins
MALRPLPGLVAHAVELLSPSGAVQVRSMFGGHGLYVDGLFVAIVAFDRLYLKADADTRERFAAAGCAPFVYEGAGRTVTLAYFAAPDDAMDSPALMQPWVRLAIDAAVRARRAKPAAAAKKPRAKPRRTAATKR